MEKRDFVTTQFGIEIEFTGITRNQAARITAEYLGGTIRQLQDTYDTHLILTPDNQTWKILYDGSVRPQRKVGGRRRDAGREYKVELVSPILTYEKDIDTLQELVRKLRKGGGFSNSSVGVHIHLNGEDHHPRSLRNFINLIYSRNDLLYQSLQIEPERIHYCKKLDERLVERMAEAKPRTLGQIEEIWYAGYASNRHRNYHESRYHFLNLHSFFNGIGTVELRGFNNPNLHAGKIRSYIVLALAMNHQALTQKSVSTRKPQIENPKFSMRTWLNRIGFIGDDFRSCRNHLCQHLMGSAAWRYQRAE
ncbi:MAG: amidoligase family protein [Bacillota bacterium]|nr:amidoligase family protein [Bacillota bacterium]MDW7677826.1 amidoligase family protein [Bacillota bacterium]